MEFLIISGIKAALVAFILLTTLAYLQWVERKVIAHIQLRMGPSRVGPHGLLQPLADVVKLITKEDLLPPHVNQFYYILAPFLAAGIALASISVIPFGPVIEVFGYKTQLGLTDLNIGLLYLLALSSLGVYGIALAGWSSNNKYALLGGLRSSAQMISYELPLALALATPLLALNTLSLRNMVEAQSGNWFGFLTQWSVWQFFPFNFIAFFLFVIAGFAETNRIPFDLPEAENELVAGFHTEYSSMKFALFFMAEYCNMITISAVATTLFLGGWLPPFKDDFGAFLIPSLIFAAGGLICLYHGMNPARPFDRITLPVFGVVFLGLAGIFQVPFLKPILQPLFWFGAKTGFLLFTFIWIRGTLPRFRYDQLMRFAWLFMFPVALVNLLAAGLYVALTSK